MRETTAIVLAAGLSRRMGDGVYEDGGCSAYLAHGMPRCASPTGGVQKLLLPVDGAPMVQHTLDLIERLPFTRRVLVTVGSVAEAVQTSAEIVYNPAPELGQSGSVRLGVLAAGEADSLMFFTGDQPFLDEATVRAILAQDDGESIVYPTGVDGLPKSPTLFASCFRETLLALQGDEGGRQVRRQFPARCRGVLVQDERALLDVDTPSEYARIREAEGLR